MSIVLVTGANRGLGKACCENLLSNGHTVIATSRKKTKGKATFKEFKAQFPEADLHFVKLDVNDKDDIKNCYSYLKKEFGHIDCLVNCAGILYTNGFEKTTPKIFSSVIETNLVAPFFLSQKMTPLLAQSKNPKIINVSSQLGSIQNSGKDWSAYRISKSAMNSMTKLMSHDLEEKNINVYSVCPGWVHTDMGGPNAPRTPKVGAASILFPFYSKRAKSGYFYQDGKRLKW